MRKITDKTGKKLRVKIKETFPLLYHTSNNK
jgi:hypothetical protein